MRPVRLLQTAGIMLLVFLVTVTAAVAKKVSPDTFNKPNAAEQRFLMQMEEINAEFVPRAEAEPENAALFFEWGMALHKVAGQSMRSYKTGGASFIEIEGMVVERLSRAVELAPENHAYARALALSSINAVSVLGVYLMDEGSSLSLARQAVHHALSFDPNDVQLLRSWSSRLIHFASVPAVAPADALKLLDEADALLENIWKMPSERPQKWVLEDRGRTAILAACRESDPVRQRAALDKAREFYERSFEYEDSLAWLHWSNALNPRDKTLTDPEFEKALLREMLIPQRLYAHAPQAIAGYGHLCINLEQVASFTEDADERLALLSEAEQVCELALDDKSSIAPNVKTTLKKIRAALKSYR